MNGIPFPPAPELAAQYAYGIAIAGIAVGVLLLVWGSKLHRLAAGVVGAVVGLAAIGVVQHQVDLDPRLVQIVMACLIAAVAAALARISWGLFAAALAGGVAWIVLLHVWSEVHVASAAAESLPQWCEHVPRGLFDWELMTSMWEAHRETIIVSVGPAAIVACLLTVIFYRPAAVILASLTGALLAVIGTVLGLGQFRPSLWPETESGYVIVGAVVVILALAGAISQFVRRSSKKAAHEAS